MMLLLTGKETRDLQFYWVFTEMTSYNIMNIISEYYFPLVNMAMGFIGLFHISITCLIPTDILYQTTIK